ncbi:carbohydrate kinase [Bacillaceae bacterium W0354]
MSKTKQILQLIKLNPYLSQQEIADQVGLSRPAVANYIKKLIESGEIVGRAYVLNDKQSITCIGGANIDRKAFSKQQVKFGSSNPVTTEETFGGVARNVAENLVRLNLNTKLLTFVGQDAEGKAIVEASQQLGIDMSLTVTIPHERTGTYTALLNPDGEMVVSLAEMDIYDQVTIDLLESRWNNISGSKAIFVDTNISEEALHFIIKKCEHSHLSLFIDPVSSAKAAKLPENLSGVHTILPNREEAELLSNVKINTLADCEKAAHAIQERGANNVIITLGEEGIFYKTPSDVGFLKPPHTKIKDVTGAGDAFAASLIYGISMDEPFHVACKYGLAGASMTLQSPQSVSQELSPEKIKQLIKELN